MLLLLVIDSFIEKLEHFPDLKSSEIYARYTVNHHYNSGTVS